MPLLKSKVRDLVVGQLYIAYSAKSKMLSSNGTNGVLVKLISISDDGRPEVEYIRPTGTRKNIKIARLEERKDAFLVPFNTKDCKDVTLKLGAAVPKTWPTFTPRMEAAAKAGIEFKLDSVMGVEERYPEELQDGTFTLMGRTANDDIATYANHANLVITSDTNAMVCSAEELEAKKREEARAKVAALKEGGVKLTVGKLEDGEKLLEAIHKHRFELMKRRRLASTSAFTVLSGDKLTPNMENSGGCHAAITMGGDLGRKFIISSIQHREGSASKESSLVWIDYLINHSPYADMCVDKDPERVFKYGLIINCDAPGNAVSSLCTASRHIWEYPVRVEAFARLHDKVDANMAFFVSLSATGKLSGTGELESLAWTGGNPEHTALGHTQMSNMGVMHWKYASPANENPSFVDADRYTTPHRVWALYEPSAKKGAVPNKTNTLNQRMKQMPSMTADKPVNAFDIPKSDVDKALEYAIINIARFLEDMGDD